MKMGIVIQPAIHAAFQDLGRDGHRHMGIGIGGPMDSFAFRLANALVGNQANAPELELAGSDFEMQCISEGLMAVTGFASVFIDGQPVPCWRPFRLMEGQSLRIQRSMEGQWAYLAVAGGWMAEEWLGSRSTFQAVGKGGYMGRNMMKGDVLQREGVISDLSTKIFQSIPKVFANWGISPKALPYSKNPVIRVMEGPEADWFDAESIDHLLHSDIFISPASNRMGYRLHGPIPELKDKDRQLPSRAVCPGNIQVTPDGSLFVLMADAQTTGGYPRIAHVTKADLHLLAQLKPGSRFRLELVSFERTIEHCREMEAEIKAIFQEISDRFS